MPESHALPRDNMTHLTHVECRPGLFNLSISPRGVLVIRKEAREDETADLARTPGAALLVASYVVGAGSSQRP